ncbi:uncharacterized protein DMAD_12434 [Drosophila madeirensis]|uniref:Uncharacterized protein n=1 Tax=Drosophila madeirensis TaxID=30013 RepID=A0AAU9FGS0_DROMD
MKSRSSGFSRIYNFVCDQMLRFQLDRRQYFLCCEQKYLQNEDQKLQLQQILSICLRSPQLIHERLQRLQNSCYEIQISLMKSMNWIH